MPKIDMAFFPGVEGSMTSEDGQPFMLQVKRPPGGDLLLGIPHSEISNIVETVAVQAGNCKDANGKKMIAAFHPSSFKASRGPEGEAALTMVVGRAGAISFLLPGNMASN